MKYFVVSDVHDHFTLLKNALEEQGFDKNNENHRLILCGDAFYNGPEPGKLFAFLKDLHESGKLIFLYGNHDIELLDNLKNKHFGRNKNRICAKGIAEHFIGKELATDEEIFNTCEALGVIEFLENVPIWYFETRDYVFTHAFIPTRNKCYSEDWREANEKEWRSAIKADAMKLSMFYKISVPNKKIVCGHYSTLRCYKMENATSADWENKIYTDVKNSPKEWLKPYIGKTFIDLDVHNENGSIVYCLVFED